MEVKLSEHTALNRLVPVASGVVDKGSGDGNRLVGHERSVGYDSIDRRTGGSPGLFYIVCVTGDKVYYLMLMEARLAGDESSLNRQTTFSWALHSVFVALLACWRVLWRVTFALCHLRLRFAHSSP